MSNDSDTEIVQQYADAGRINDLPPRTYVLDEPIILA